MKKYIIIAFALAFSACERVDEPIGPSLADTFGEFAVISAFDVSAKSADFANSDRIFFTATFNKTVNWQLEIIGESSGAKKIITGFSNELDDDNSIWNGTTTELPMFKSETCTAILSVPTDSINGQPYSDTITNIQVNSTRVYEGFVVADFENGINPGWTIFAQSGANMSFRIVTDPTAAEGNAYYDMGGEVDFDFLIGLIDMPSSAYGTGPFPLDDNPDNVYFNVLLDKPEGINNEIVLIRFSEDDNGDGTFQESSEDQYSLELRGLETNWQLISERYSDLVALVNGAPATPNGNGLHEPDKIIQISVLFLADPSSGYSQTLMDYMIFTEGKALQP